MIVIRIKKMFVKLLWEGFFFSVQYFDNNLCFSLALSDVTDCLSLDQVNFVL